MYKDSIDDYQTKSRDYVSELFKNAASKNLIKKYIKNATVLARPAMKGEKIITIVGKKKETENIAKEGEFIIENPGGEQYIISGKEFKENYKLIGEIKDSIGFKQYQAKGCIWGFEYHGPNFKFLSSWGKYQIVEHGDMLVSKSKVNYEDIYRIEKEAFHNTYRKAN